MLKDKPLRILIILLVFTFSLVNQVSGQAPLQVLYTSYTINGDKETPAYQSVYQYDNKGRIKTNSAYNWKESESRLALSATFEYGYDNDNRQVFEKYIQYRYLSDTIQSTSIFNKVYDDIGNLIQYTITETYFDNPNVSTFAINYTYSSKGCEQRKDITSSINGIIRYNYYILYTRDDQCREVLTQTTFITPSDFISSFETFEYEGGNLVAERGYSVSQGDTSLVTESLFEYNNANQKILEQQTNSWKEEYAYDGEGRLINKKSYAWDASLSEWMDRGETSFEFNAAGQLTIEQSEYDGFTFILQREYDDDGNNTRTLTYYFFSENNFQYYTEAQNTFRCDGAYTGSKIYDLASGQPKLVTRSQTEYLFPAACEATQGQTITLFPNPTSGQVNVLANTPLETYQVRVYNSAGQLIHVADSEEAILPALLDFSALPPGLYILSVTGNSFHASSKLIRN
jgi:YD repeat-containing protein